MPDDIDWLVLGDFNLIRYPENRIRPGGNINNMFAFNEALSKLRLLEQPLYGQRYTRTNKQERPLLQRLDWFLHPPHGQLNSQVQKSQPYLETSQTMCHVW